MIHLLYHANCADGFAAACIARHALINVRKCRPENLLLHPIGYDDALQCPLGISPADALIYVDYTPPPNIITRILASGARLTMIDHHKSAATRYLNLPDTDRLAILYDTSQSGTMLTWKHFFPKVSTPPPAPLLYLQHYDLGGVWNDPQHPLTNEARWLVAYLMRCLPRTPEAWTPFLLAYDAPGTQHRLAAQEIGARLYTADQRAIRGLIKGCHWVNVGGFEVPALNGCPYGLLNDALAELLIEHPDVHFAAAWNILSDADTGGVIKWSLRSRKNGFDCAALCQSIDPATDGKPGGGGHPQAAGFSTLDPVHFL